MVLALYESPAGYALFKIVDEGVLNEPEKLQQRFATVDDASKTVKLKSFSAFADTNEALAAASALLDGSLPKDLKKFLKKKVAAKNVEDKIAVIDPKLGSLIKEKLGLECIYDKSVMELMRGLRSQIDGLLGESTEADLRTMSLGLAHSLSRYKLKFSPDKVDTMIVQAIGLLDDLDKEINTYAMRLKEWFGWHFPEMAKIVTDNIMYARTVQKMGDRSDAPEMDFSDILPEEIEADLKEVLPVSMGTEIAEEDKENIQLLCQEVISMADYRAELFEYLRNRMSAIAPNLTALVGELVGARLISHAGSLVNLAKYPASTIQILGAEKALFRALKTKHDTPKYGLIYHASLVGQCAPQNKGKISRVLAAKCALSVRVDALGDSSEATIGLEDRERVENRLRVMEGGVATSLSKPSRSGNTPKKYTPEGGAGYNAAADSTLDEPTPKAGKRSRSEVDEDEAASSSDEEAERPAKVAKKDKKEKKEKKDKKEKKEKKDKKEKKEKKDKKEKKEKKKKSSDE